MGIELELTQYLEEESADALINQFPVAANIFKAQTKSDKMSRETEQKTLLVKTSPKREVYSLSSSTKGYELPFESFLYDWI